MSITLQAGLLLIALLLPACTEYVRLDPSDPRCGDFRRGDTYELQQDVALIDRTGLGPRRLQARPIDRYLIQSEVEGRLHAGCLISLEDVFFYDYWEGTTTIPMGVVLDGEYKGKEVDLGWLTEPIFEPRFDPSLLRPTSGGAP